MPDLSVLIQTAQQLVDLLDPPRPSRHARLLHHLDSSFYPVNSRGIPYDIKTAIQDVRNKFDSVGAAAWSPLVSQQRKALKHFNNSINLANVLFGKLMHPYRARFDAPWRRDVHLTCLRPQCTCFEP